ncbi:MAG: hypothetical protein GC205_08275 [Bacteroidetes bacterium]|nr:hypothetical protein [Bacteroidota bacterium]
MNATKRKTASRTVVPNQSRRLHRFGSGLRKVRPAVEPARQRPPQAAVPLRRRVDAPDPHRALARVRTVRGQRVLLERDLASALGTLPGRLADLALRHADWFPETARFALSASEAVQQGLWYTRSDGSQTDVRKPLSRAGHSRNADCAVLNQAAFPPLAPVVYAMDGLIAAAHWLSTEAARAGDPYAECADLSARFRLAWAALDPDRS